MALPAYATPPQRIWHYAERLIAGFVFLILTGPILVVFPISFSSGSLMILPTPGFSLQWYEEVFGSTLWLHAAQNSLFTALSATALAMVLGTLAALGLDRLSGWPKTVLSGLTIAPIVVPIAIVGVASYFFFAWAGLVRTYAGIILALTVLSVPFVVVTVSATLAKYDRTMTRAAASLGANPLKAFLTVTLPIILPGIVSGGLFAFAVAFDDLVMVLFLAAPEQATLPRVIFSGIRENISPAVAAAAVILTLISLGLMFGAELFRRRGDRLRGVSD